MGAGRTRFMRGPSLTYASLTNNRSTSTSSLRLVALAIALSSTLTTVGAMRLLVVRSVVRAFSTCWPRIKSTTRRAFCADTRIYLASAFTCSMAIPLCGLGSLLGRRLNAVPFELTGRRKLAQLVPDHVLRHVHRDELLPVVHRDRVPYELRKNRRAARPGAHHLLLVGGIQHRQLGFQMRVGERSLLYASAHE